MCNALNAAVVFLAYVIPIFVCCCRMNVVTETAFVRAAVFVVRVASTSVEQAKDLSHCFFEQKVIFMYACLR